MEYKKTMLKEISTILYEQKQHNLQSSLFKSSNIPQLALIKNVKCHRNLVRLEQSENALFYSLKIENTTIQCQIDTGSSVTLIDQKYKEIFNCVKKLPDISLYSYNNHKISCVGRYCVYIYIFPILDMYI